MFLEAVLANALGGIATVFLIALYKRYVSESREVLKWRQAFKLFIISSLLVFLTDFTPMPVGETIRVGVFGPPSQNERLTLEAWRAFERRDYLAAIASAEEVIDLYGGVAERQQSEFEQHKEPMPPVGKVAPWDASKIFPRGLLNDVATSYWIAGQSYEQIDNGCKAKQAYTEASRLTYARTWDPQWWPLRGWSPFGWFWSPAEVAQDRISRVQCP